MNKQRGEIAPIWLYLAGAIALVLALTGLVAAWESYTTGLDKKGYDRGVSETESAYKTRDNKQLQAALAAQEAAEDRAAQAEAKADAAAAVASNNYQKGVQDGQKQTDARIAAVGAGTLRLSDPGHQARPSPACGLGIGASSPLTAVSGSDDAAPAGLSAEASGFLLKLTGEADDTARQLALAQARILSDIETCNSK